MYGVIGSWAVSKGMPQRSGVRRLAIQVVDHTLEYFDFEGTILYSQDGAGTVRIWGTCLNLIWSESTAGRTLHVQGLLYLPRAFLGLWLSLPVT
jgi:hypothetical protein